MNVEHDDDRSVVGRLRQLQRALPHIEPMSAERVQRMVKHRQRRSRVLVTSAVLLVAGLATALPLTLSGGGAPATKHIATPEARGKRVVVPLTAAGDLAPACDSPVDARLVDPATGGAATGPISVDENQDSTLTATVTVRRSVSFMAAKVLVGTPNSTGGAGDPSLLPPSSVLKSSNQIAVGTTPQLTSTTRLQVTVRPSAAGTYPVYFYAEWKETDPRCGAGGPPSNQVSEIGSVTVP